MILLTEEKLTRRAFFLNDWTITIQKIKITAKLNLSKFLHTGLICFNGIYISKTYRTSTKLPIAWSSTVPPKPYKRNAIFGDLH